MLEWIKLIAIIGGGVAVIVIFAGMQKRKGKEKNQVDSFSSSSAGSSGDYSNNQIKEYILTYKGKFEREGIKKSLVAAGHPEAEVERYLQKFF